jgi:hypothetical protein
MFRLTGENWGSVNSHANIEAAHISIIPEPQRGAISILVKISDESVRRALEIRHMAGELLFGGLVS